MNEPMKKIGREVRFGTPTMCAPAIRMVVITAWANAEDDGHIVTYHRIFPVVALLTVEKRGYEKMTPMKNPVPHSASSEKELLIEGWMLNDRELFHTAIIVDDDYGLIPWDDDLFKDVTNAASSLACCPWPPDEDDAKLVKQIADARESAEQRCLARSEKLK